jgi:hypothetical protein
MADFSVRSENVDVEQIMRQIRARIREKRGVDYTEEEIRELANVKLEKFIDPKGVRSGLLEEYRRVSKPEPPAPNFAFGEDTLYETHRGPIRWLRTIFRPFLKLLFNPNPLIQALHIQAELNARNAERAARREQLDALHYEVIHNLVVELTRTGVEVKSLTMRLESMASRLDFDERRARALEGVVQYRAGAVAPLQPPTGQDRQDQARRDQARRDQGQRHQGPRDQGFRNQGQRFQGQQRVPQSQVPQSQVPQSAGPQSAGPQSAETASFPTQGPPTQGPGDQGLPGNALDADGNERRARRRRRRGRRRPGDRPAFGEGTDPRRDAGSAMREGAEVQGPGVEIAATQPEQPAERDVLIAPRESPLPLSPRSGYGETSPKPAPVNERAEAGANRASDADGDSAGTPSTPPADPPSE